MKTIEIQLFKFQELTSEAQQNAIQKERESMFETGDFLYFFSENCSDYCAEKGFKNAKVQYSLSYSQGDGLSFSADMDLVNLIKEAKPGIKQSVLDAVLNNCYACCEGNKGGYCFARPEDVSFYIETNSWNEYERFTEYVRDIKRYLQDKYMEICGTLEANGYSEIEYQQSDENIIETLKSNDYDFTAEGELY